MAEQLIPFDQREGSIWMNGALVPWKDAKIHVICHGLHYASSVFEGVRAYGGKVFRMTGHNQRLLDSARLVDFEIPYTVEELNAATKAVLAAQGITNGYIRPVAWKGSENMAVDARENKVHVAIAAWEWPSYYKADEGIRLTLANWKRPSPETAPTASKAAGLYMIATMSKQYAARKGYHDALMLDYRGYVAEATSANFFAVINGELHTPTPDCFLNGITRQTIIALAKKEGIPVIERHIQLEELGAASEAFLTGTAAEVTPVGEIDTFRYPVGPVTTVLREKYKALVLEEGE